MMSLTYLMLVFCYLFPQKMNETFTVYVRNCFKASNEAYLDKLTLPSTLTYLSSFLDISKSFNAPSSSKAIPVSIC